MDAFKTERYHRPVLILLAVVLVLLSSAMVRGACNDFVPSVDPFPPGGFIGGPSPFAQVDPNTGGTPCPFAQDSGTGAQDPFAPGGFIGGPCPFPQVDPNTGGTPCPFSSQTTAGPSSAIQALANSLPCTAGTPGTTAGSESTSGSGSSGGSGSSAGSGSSGGAEASSGSVGAQQTSSGNSSVTSQGNATNVSCPLYPGLNTNPTTSPTPVPTIVPQPPLKPVPQEPGPIKYSATGWSDITYKMPTDPNKDGLYEDLNGDGHVDFMDVILLFKDQEWLQENEPIQYFDFDGDHVITFEDVITLFKELPDGQN